jgi:lantibiotic modifying enzyme
MLEEDEDRRTLKEKIKLQELNEHLPEWIKLLRELYVSECEKKKSEENSGLIKLN